MREKVLCGGVVAGCCEVGAQGHCSLNKVAGAAQDGVPQSCSKRYNLYISLLHQHAWLHLLAAKSCVCAIAVFITLPLSPSGLVVVSISSSMADAQQPDQPITDANGIDEAAPPADEQVVTPWDVAGGADGKIDYNKLVEQFGCQTIGQDLVQRIERLTGMPAHPFLKRGVFFAHR